MKATNSSSDLASTGGTQKGDSPHRTGIVGLVRMQLVRILMTASTTASDTWAVAVAKLSPTVVQARQMTLGAVEGVQQRCSKVVELSKSGFATAIKEASDRTTSAKCTITDILAHTRSIVTNAARKGQERALHYIPASVTNRITQARSSLATRSAYVRDSMSNFVQSTRDKVSDTAASTKAAATKHMDTAKAMVADLVEHATRAAGAAVPTPLKTRVAAASTWASSHGAAAQQTLLSVTQDVREKARLAADASQAEVCKLKAAVQEVASDERAPLAAAAAAGGAVAGGSTGATVGVVSGTVLGAAAGVVPALFTFGLSIPIGAVLGGGAGACIGTVVGSTVGGVAGGAAGWKKDEIRQAASNAIVKAGECTESVKETATTGANTVFAKAGDCTEYVKETATASKEYAQKKANVTTSYLRERVQKLGSKAGDCTEYVKETAAASKQYAQKQAAASTNYVRERVPRLGATGGTEPLFTGSD